MRDPRSYGTGFMVMGLGLLLGHTWGYAHTQQRALLELVKRLERNRA